MNDLDRIWNERLYVYDPTQALERQLPCVFARAFQAWVDILFSRHLDQADHVRLNQLKLVLQDKYFEIQSRSPQDHRHDESRDPDHLCVYSVYARAIETIHGRELDLAPRGLPSLVVDSQTERPAQAKRTPLDDLLFGDEDPEFGG